VDASGGLRSRENWFGKVKLGTLSGISIVHPLAETRVQEIS